MGIIAAFAVPHPPLIIPTVGRGQESAVQGTIDAYRKIARRIAELEPETIIVASPHAPLYRDCFYLAMGDTARGDMERFGAPQSVIEKRYDKELNTALVDIARQHDIPVYAHTDFDMDHATFVPLYFVEQEYKNYEIVRLGLSGRSPLAHREWGAAVAKAVREVGRRCVFIASGDLSHKLKPDGPYGFAAEGPRFDERIANLFSEGNLDGLFDFDETFCELAAECGLRAFQVMAGALERRPCTHDLLSYEGPFGVGYAVAAFEPLDCKCSVHNFDCETNDCETNDCAVENSVFGCERNQDQDSYVSFARTCVEHFVKTGETLDVAAITDELTYGLNDELLRNRAGVFVSLHEKGQLRGCIGTIQPTTENIACEIARNAASAAARDPRFPPVRENELDFLSYSVDVLMPPELIDDESMLDPLHWGVIVSKGWQRGLLLPALDGVDTVEMQVAIAKQKAGISVNDKNVQLERFEVVRHDKGGQARCE